MLNIKEQISRVDFKIADILSGPTQIYVNDEFEKDDKRLTHSDSPIDLEIENFQGTVSTLVNDMIFNRIFDFSSHRPVRGGRGSQMYCRGSLRFLRGFLPDFPCHNANEKPSHCTIFNLHTMRGEGYQQNPVWCTTRTRSFFIFSFRN